MEKGRARMPRTTLAFVTALMFCGAVLTDHAHGQVDRARLPNNRAPNNTVSNNTVSNNTVSQGPLEANSPLAQRMPLRLVKRSKQVERPAAGARYGKPIDLPAPKHTRPGDQRRPLDGRGTTQSNVTWVVMSSLAIVLGLFFLVVWIARRALPKSTTTLSTDVLDVLGRAPLGNRHNLQLIRLGRRLLLVSVTPDNAQTLTEITDPDEVNHLASLCQQQQPGSITGSFRQVLQQLGSQQPTPSRRSRGASNSLNPDASAKPQQQPSLRQVRELS